MEGPDESSRTGAACTMQPPTHDNMEVDQNRLMCMRQYMGHLLALVLTDQWHRMTPETCKIQANIDDLTDQWHRITAQDL